MQLRRAAVIGGAVMAASPALAGDYAESCSSANGAFRLEAETLTSDYAGGTALPHRITHETVLREIEGYCLSSAQPEQKFGFAARVTAITVTTEIDGLPLRIDLICEVASSGLPAAYKCDEEVITRRSGAHIEE